MVQFKTLRWKHYRRAKELLSQLEKGTIDEDVLLKFALELVASWDFVDADTNKPIKVGEMDELSLEQVGEVFDSFRVQFEGLNKEVPKTSD